MALINRNTKLRNNTWVLCKTPLFSNESNVFINQYKDRKIHILERYDKWIMYLVTIDEVIHFWGLNRIFTFHNKQLKTPCCILYKLPVPFNNDDNIQSYIKLYDNTWNLNDLERYDINFDNK